VAGSAAVRKSGVTGRAREEQGSEEREKEKEVREKAFSAGSPAGSSHKRIQSTRAAAHVASPNRPLLLCGPF